MVLKSIQTGQTKMASDYTFLYLFQISDEERYWVITEICSEPSAVKRIKIIKQFIRIASK